MMRNNAQAPYPDGDDMNLDEFTMQVMKLNVIQPQLKSELSVADVSVNE